MGANGILAIMEAYFPVDDDGVYKYFKAIADATSLPVVIYTNPNFQRSDLSIPTIERHSHIPHIRGINTAYSNTSPLLSIMNRSADLKKGFPASTKIPAT